MIGPVTGRVAARRDMDETRTMASTSCRMSRRMFELVEPIGVVPYATPEPTEEMFALGFTNYWDTYFAGRAAPLGMTTAEVVDAIFYNFAPGEVARHIPKVWEVTTPEAAIAAIRAGSGRALRRILGDRIDTPGFSRAAELLTRAATSAPTVGRPMYAALRSVPEPDDVVGRLFHAASLLREHRGDGHVAALLTAGLGGLEAHVVLVAAGVVDAEQMRRARGWSEDDWASAERGLVDRGLLEPSGGLTEEGARLRREVEAVTDRLAMEPWDHLGDEATGRLHELLDPLARRIVASGELPYPNPMGLTPPG